MTTQMPLLLTPPSCLDAHRSSETEIQSRQGKGKGVQFHRHELHIQRLALERSPPPVSLKGSLLNVFPVE